MPDGQPRYKRILLKLSGEAGVGGEGFGIDPKTLQAVAEDIGQVVNAGVQICLVVGGGNIFRGAALAESGMERASADYMGMLATVMNALALQATLEKVGVYTRVQSAIPMEAVCEPYIRRRALRHLEKGRVVIFAAGLGAPFFTTDTPAALRAAEMGCDVLSKDLRVMDTSAVSLMRDNHIPIVVFSIRERGNLLKVLCGDGVYTTIA